MHYKTGWTPARVLVQIALSMSSKFHRSIDHAHPASAAPSLSQSARGSFDDPLMWPEKPGEPDNVRQRREERDALYDRATVAAHSDIVRRDQGLLAVRYRAFMSLKNELLEANVCLACGRQCKPHELCQCENDE